MRFLHLFLLSFKGDVMVKLKDIGTIITGNTPKTSDVQNYATRDIPFVKPSDISDNSVSYLYDSEFYISEYARNKARVIPANSILFTCIGIIGKVAINKVECAFNQQINAIIPNEDVCLAEYLVYALQSRKELLQETANAPVVPILNKTQFSEIEISLPTIEKQDRIAKDLNKVCSLITAHEEQLLKLDELVKARFVEMFGEQLEKETVKLSTLTDVITKGTTPTTLGFEFIESGINFVKIECITEDGKFLVSKMLHISDECNQKLKRSILKENDVLFSIAGAIGRTAIVTKDILPANTNQAIAIIRLKPNSGLNVNFLNQMLHSSLIEHQVNVKKAGVAQINLSLADISDFNVVVPSIEEQEQFSTFVKQIDKSKFAVQQSLDKLETLKKALMQKYFN